MGTHTNGTPAPWCVFGAEVFFVGDCFFFKAKKGDGARKEGAGRGMWGQKKGFLSFFLGGGRGVEKNVYKYKRQYVVKSGLVRTITVASGSCEVFCVKMLG